MSRAKPTRKPSRRRNSAFCVEALEQRLALASAYQNPGNPLDVNDDLVINPRDVLVGVNVLNKHGSRALPILLDGQPAEMFFDTDGNGRHDPVDVLLIINALNRNRAEITVRAESSLRGFAEPVSPLDANLIGAFSIAKVDQLFAAVEGDDLADYINVSDTIADNRFRIPIQRLLGNRPISASYQVHLTTDLRQSNAGVKYRFGLDSDSPKLSSSNALRPYPNLISNYTPYIGIEVSEPIPANGFDLSLARLQSLSAEGEPVGSIRFKDVTFHEERRVMRLHPVNALLPGKYQFVLDSKAIKDRAGNSLGEPIVIEFVQEALIRAASGTPADASLPSANPGQQIRITVPNVEYFEKATFEIVKMDGSRATASADSVKVDNLKQLAWFKVPDNAVTGDLRIEKHGIRMPLQIVPTLSKTGIEYGGSLTFTGSGFVPGRTEFLANNTPIVDHNSTNMVVKNNDNAVIAMPNYDVLAQLKRLSGPFVVRTDGGWSEPFSADFAIDSVALRGTSSTQGLASANPYQLIRVRGKNLNEAKILAENMENTKGDLSSVPLLWVSSTGEEALIYLTAPGTYTLYRLGAAHAVPIEVIRDSSSSNNEDFALTSVLATAVEGAPLNPLLPSTNPGDVIEIHGSGLHSGVQLKFPSVDQPKTFFVKTADGARGQVLVPANAISGTVFVTKTSDNSVIGSFDLQIVPSISRVSFGYGNSISIDGRGFTKDSKVFIDGSPVDSHLYTISPSEYIHLNYRLGYSTIEIQTAGGSTGTRNLPPRVVDLTGTPEVAVFDHASGKPADETKPWRNVGQQIDFKYPSGLTLPGALFDAGDSSGDQHVYSFNGVPENARSGLVRALELPLVSSLQIVPTIKSIGGDSTSVGSTILIEGTGLVIDELRVTIDGIVAEHRKSDLGPTGILEVIVPAGVTTGLVMVTTHGGSDSWVPAAAISVRPGITVEIPGDSPATATPLDLLVNQRGAVSASLSSGTNHTYSLDLQVGDRLSFGFDTSHSVPYGEFSLSDAEGKRLLFGESGASAFSPRLLTAPRSGKYFISIGAYALPALRTYNYQLRMIRASGRVEGLGVITPQAIIPSNEFPHIGSGNQGQTIQLRGDQWRLGEIVYFSGGSSKVTSVSEDGAIATVTVPIKAVSGRVQRASGAGRFMLILPVVVFSSIDHSTAESGLAADPAIPNANPGQTITLRGIGFNSTTLVRLSGSPVLPKSVAEDGSWLTVTIPVWASSGIVSVDGAISKHALGIVPLVRSVHGRQHQLLEVSVAGLPYNYLSGPEKATFRFGDTVVESANIRQLQLDFFRTHPFGPVTLQTSGGLSESLDYPLALLTTVALSGTPEDSSLPSANPVQVVRFISTDITAESLFFLDHILNNGERSITALRLSWISPDGTTAEFLIPADARGLVKIKRIGSSKELPLQIVRGTRQTYDKVVPTLTAVSSVAEFGTPKDPSVPSAHVRQTITLHGKGLFPGATVAFATSEAKSESKITLASDDGTIAQVKVPWNAGTGLVTLPGGEGSVPLQIVPTISSATFNPENGRFFADTSGNVGQSAVIRVGDTVLSGSDVYNQHGLTLGPVSVTTPGGYAEFAEIPATVYPPGSSILSLLQVEPLKTVIGEPRDAATVAVNVGQTLDLEFLTKDNYSISVLDSVTIEFEGQGDLGFSGPVRASAKVDLTRGVFSVIVPVGVRSGTIRLLGSNRALPIQIVPQIRSVIGDSRTTGAIFQLEGTGFVSSELEVTIDGIPAAVSNLRTIGREQFLDVVVPEGASAGRVTLQTSGGSDSWQPTRTVISVAAHGTPQIASLPSANFGQQIVITGSGLTPEDRVVFLTARGAELSVIPDRVADDGTSLTATVPDGAATGSVRLEGDRWGTYLQILPFGIEAILSVAASGTPANPNLPSANPLQSIVVKGWGFHPYTEITIPTSSGFTWARIRPTRVSSDRTLAEFTIPRDAVSGSVHSIPLQIVPTIRSVEYDFDNNYLSNGSIDAEGCDGTTELTTSSSKTFSCRAFSFPVNEQLFQPFSIRSAGGTSSLWETGFELVSASSSVYTGAPVILKRWGVDSRTDVIIEFLNERGEVTFTGANVTVNLDDQVTFYLPSQVGGIVYLRQVGTSKRLPLQVTPYITRVLPQEDGFLHIIGTGFTADSVIKLTDSSGNESVPVGELVNGDDSRKDLRIRTDVTTIREIAVTTPGGTGRYTDKVSLLHIGEIKDLAIDRQSGDSILATSDRWFHFDSKTGDVAPSNGYQFPANQLNADEVSIVDPPANTKFGDITAPAGSIILMTSKGRQFQLSLISDGGQLLATTNFESDYRITTIRWFVQLGKLVGLYENGLVAIEFVQGSDSASTATVRAFASIPRMYGVGFDEDPSSNGFWVTSTWSVTRYTLTRYADIFLFLATPHESLPLPGRSRFVLDAELMALSVFRSAVYQTSLLPQSQLQGIQAVAIKGVPRNSELPSANVFQEIELLGSGFSPASRIAFSDHSAKPILVQPTFVSSDGTRVRVSVPYQAATGNVRVVESGINVERSVFLQIVPTLELRQNEYNGLFSVYATGVAPHDSTLRIGGIEYPATDGTVVFQDSSLFFPVRLSTPGGSVELDSYTIRPSAGRLISANTRVPFDSRQMGTIEVLPGQKLTLFGSSLGNTDQVVFDVVDRTGIRGLQFVSGDFSEFDQTIEVTVPSNAISGTVRLAGSQSEPIPLTIVSTQTVHGDPKAIGTTLLITSRTFINDPATVTIDGIPAEVMKINEIALAEGLVERVLEVLVPAGVSNGVVMVNSARGILRAAISTLVTDSQAENGRPRYAGFPSANRGQVINIRGVDLRPDDRIVFNGSGEIVPQSVSPDGRTLTVMVPKNAVSGTVRLMRHSTGTFLQIVPIIETAELDSSRAIRITVDGHAEQSFHIRVDGSLRQTPATDEQVLVVNSRAFSVPRSGFDQLEIEGDWGTVELNPIQVISLESRAAMGAPVDDTRPSANPGQRVRLHGRGTSAVTLILVPVKRLGLDSYEIVIPSARSDQWIDITLPLNATSGFIKIPGGQQAYLQVIDPTWPMS